MVVSILALHTEGDRGIFLFLGRGSGVSILALHTEGDIRRAFGARGDGSFYPRPPYGGRRRAERAVSDGDVFLSSPSIRRATPSAVRPGTLFWFLSSPSIRRATYVVLRAVRDPAFLSSPSIRRATSPLPNPTTTPPPFLSSPSIRRATVVGAVLRDGRDVSILALHTEGDEAPYLPAPPDRAFLSSPSIRRATALNGRVRLHRAGFYPRPPYGGRLYSILRLRAPLMGFYPRPPYGGRPPCRP